MKRKTRLENFQEWIKPYGLYVVTWSPGDGVTRYRFYDSPHRYYDNGNELYTALGYKEAVIFARGFIAGIYNGRKL